MDVARLGNKYLADTEPWKLIKSNPDRVQTILNIALQIAATLSAISEPFLPFSSKKLKEMINLGDISWLDAGKGDHIQGGHQLNKPQLLFEKIEDDIIQRQMDKLKKEDESEPIGEPMKEIVNYDDFMRMDLRVGEILEAEKVPKSNKLLKFLVDTGVDKRTILSGVAKYFTPEEMIGKKVTVLLNLAPRKIMGIESEGMLLFAENQDGELKPVTPDVSAENGASIS